MLKGTSLEGFCHTEFLQEKSWVLDPDWGFVQISLANDSAYIWPSQNPYFKCSTSYPKGKQLTATLSSNMEHIFSLSDEEWTKSGDNWLCSCWISLRGSWRNSLYRYIAFVMLCTIALRFVILYWPEILRGYLYKS